MSSLRIHTTAKAMLYRSDLVCVAQFFRSILLSHLFFFHDNSSNYLLHGLDSSDCIDNLTDLRQYLGQPILDL